MSADLAEHVQRIVDTFPPLTAELRDQVAELLRAPGEVLCAEDPNAA